MKQWEYKVASLWDFKQRGTIEEQLNALGAEGWELIQVPEEMHDGALNEEWYVVLKREKLEMVEKPGNEKSSTAGDWLNLLFKNSFDYCKTYADACNYLQLQNNDERALALKIYAEEALISFVMEKDGWKQDAEGKWQCQKNKE